MSEKCGKFSSTYGVSLFPQCLWATRSLGKCRVSALVMLYQTRTQTQLNAMTSVVMFFNVSSCANDWIVWNIVTHPLLAWFDMHRSKHFYVGNIFFSLRQAINVRVCPFVRNISSRVVYSIRVLGYLLIFFFQLIRTVGWFNIISTIWFYANTWVFFLQIFQWVFFQRHTFALDDPLQSLIHYTQFYPIFSAMLIFFNCFFIR